MFFLCCSLKETWVSQAFEMGEGWVWTCGQHPELHLLLQSDLILFSGASHLPSLSYFLVYLDNCLQSFQDTCFRSLNQKKKRNKIFLKACHKNKLNLTYCQNIYSADLRGLNGIKSFRQCWIRREMFYLACSNTWQLLWESQSLHRAFFHEEVPSTKLKRDLRNHFFCFLLE